MPDLATAQALQPHRITAYFSAAAGGLVTLTNFALLRSGTTVHAVSAAWLRPGSGGAVVELALEDPLLDGELYILSHALSSTTVRVAWREPLRSPALAPRSAPEIEAPDDPEAEAFGVDVDWFADSLDARGDVPVARGLGVLKHDLAALAVLEPGELVHRPSAGVGLRRRVNGTPLDNLEGELRAAYLADSRVRDCTVSAGRDGAATRLRTSVLVPQLSGQSIDFVTRI